MARVTYGESITEYAGSIGGITYQKNRSGNIAKLRSNPTVNPSPYQSIYQTQFAMLVALWPTLSLPNKIDWDDHAAAHKHTTPWGAEKTLSGYQWFLLCNILRLHYHPAPILTPGAWVPPSPPEPFTIETSSTYIRAAWDPPDIFTHMLGYISLPLRQSSLKLRRSLFFRGYKVVGSPVTNWDFTSFFETLANVTWADFYASANCHIIIRIMHGTITSGYFSSFTSAITKLPPPV
jgi:hypothetical protein